MKILFTLILAITFYFPLALFPKNLINDIEVFPQYHFDDQFFRKGLDNKELIDTECLAYMIYAEARGESDEGQIAVAFVIKNRATKWNKSICSIVRQPGEFHARINKLYTQSDKEAWRHAINIAYFLNERNGYIAIKSPVDDAIYFNSLPANQQYIMGGGRLRGKIGHHYFYGSKRS